MKKGSEVIGKFSLLISPSDLERLQISVVMNHMKLCFIKYPAFSSDDDNYTQ